MSGKTISNLSVGLFGDVSHFAHAFGTTAKNSTASWAKSMEGAGGIALKLGGVVAGLGAVTAATAFVIKGFRAESAFETANVRLGAMLGNMQQAKGILTDLRQLSVSTPMEFGDMAGTAKELAAFGTAADQIEPTIVMLGNLAAGSGTSVEELAQLFVRAKEEGRLSGREIREFTNAGIPLTDALAKSMGKTPEQIRRMLEAGQVTFPQLQAGLIQLTSGGGKFNDMLGKTSHTLSGEWTRIWRGLADIPAQFVAGLGADNHVEDVMEGINRIIVSGGKLAHAFGAAVGYAVDKLWEGLEVLKGWIKQFEIGQKIITWISDLAGKPITVPPPKIDPLKPMALNVTPHVEGHSLIRWGSAEMLRIQQEWAGQFPKMAKQATSHAAKSLNMNDPAVAGYFAQKAGRFKEYVQSLMHGKGAGSKNRLDQSALNSTTFDIQDTDSYVGPDGKRHKYSKDHPNPYAGKILHPGNIGAAIDALKPVMANGLKSPDGQYRNFDVWNQHRQPWYEAMKKQQQEKIIQGWKPDDVQKSVYYQFQTWQLLQNQSTQIANF